MNKELPEEIKLWIENLAVERFPIELIGTVPDDGTRKAYRNAQLYNRQTFIAGATSLYHHLKEERDKEIELLKEKINELTMSDMTHEYNQAEAEKLAPEYERQIKEPLEKEIERLKDTIFKLTNYEDE